MYFTQLCLPVRACKLPQFMEVSIGPKIKICGSTYCHGIVFAPKQCLYQKEANVTKSLQIFSTHWCKNRTYLYGPVKV